MVIYNNQYNFKRKTIFPSRESKKYYNFYWSRYKLWETLVKRLEEDKDNFILVSAKTGAGKSTLIGKILFNHAMLEDNFMKKDGSKMFEPEIGFIIDPDEFAYKMITQEGSVLWADEGRNIGNRQQWFSKINQAVANRKNKNRKLKNTYFIAIPYETEFDPKLALHLTMWIWVKRRGIAEIYVPRSGRKGVGGLDINKIIEREEKYLKENPKTTFIPPTIHPEYVGRIRFSKFSKKENKLYQRLVKEKKATGELSEEEKEKYGLNVTKQPKQIVLDAIEKIKKGEITNKKDLWLEIDKIDDTQTKKLKLLDFYLKLEGWGTFNKLFEKGKLKKQTIEIEW